MATRASDRADLDLDQEATGLDHHQADFDQTGPARRNPHRHKKAPKPSEDDDDYLPTATSHQALKRKAAATTAIMQIERKVKLVTEQKTIDKPSPMPEFPMKEWSVKIYVLDQNDNEHPANCFTKVTYNLHPSFENPNQTFHEAPFTCTNEGWGEFEMSIDMFTTEKGGKSTVFHDLNFQKPSYDVITPVVFKNPSQALLQILRETGPVTSDDDPKVAKARKANDGKKRKPGYDYEKMADAMGKLDDDNLLHVIQMIHDHKSDETYTKNDMDAGEFSVDLFTMPDHLSKMLWDFLLEQKLAS